MIFVSICLIRTKVIIKSNFYDKTKSMTDIKSKQSLDNLSSDSIDAQSQAKESSNDRQWLKIASFLLVIGVVGGIGWYWYQNKNSQSSQAANQPPPPAGVKISTLSTAIIQESTDFLGSLEAQQTVDLNPEEEGRIVEIYAREGQFVNQGKNLFRLDSQTLRAELNQVRANLASRQARLAELQAGSRQEDIAAAKARVRQAEVRLANSRIGSSQAEIAQARAQLTSAQAEAELAQQKVKRYRLLRQEGAISQDQFDDFLTQAKTASAEVNVAQKRLEELQRGTTADTAELQAAVEEAKQNLTLLQNGTRKEEIDQAQADVQEARANIQRIGTLLDKTFVKAPISGKVGDIPVNVGEYVGNDDVLTTITQNTQLELNIAIPLEKASDLQIGLPVQILNEQKEAIANGKIGFIESNVTSDSQLIGVKAVFNNNNLNRQLLNRQFIQSRIIWDTSTGILIPTSSVFRIGGQAFVFTAEPNPEGEGLVAKQRAITLGDIQKNEYEVLEGLKNGDKILTAGILQVEDGAAIQELLD